MRVRAYKVEHDFGFAPNPFFGVCTLACCRPALRHKAKLNDLVLGLGTAATGTLGQLTYWMYVDQISDFNTYFRDPLFQRKKPLIGGAKRRRYGDNIYWREASDEPFQQLDSFHAHPDLRARRENIENDTGLTDKVLIGRHFGYFGGTGPKIPKRFSLLTRSGMRYRCNFPELEKAGIIDWISGLPSGYKGDPASWGKLKAT